MDAQVRKMSFVEEYCLLVPYSRTHIRTHDSILYANGHSSGCSNSLHLAMIKVMAKSKLRSKGFT